ncbi:MAG: polysaccharide pyruvyl transferase family protein [Eubacterium sp.]|nr:polysaccharide pyruvyl transferase family protein [Eubacterium sp.]
MKILLNGATGGTNFGDFLFAEAFQQEVGKLIGKDNVHWYESRYTLSKFFKKYLKYDKTYNLSEIDGLLCISGGYFCGNDRTIKNYIIRYLMYFRLCIKCIQKKIPIAIIGIEIGIPRNILMRKIQGYILKRCSMLVVRNKESFNNLKAYGVENAVCTTDTAHAIVENLGLNDKTAQDCKKLFIHIDPSCINSQKKLINPINIFLSNHPEYKVYLGTDQKRKNEEELVEYLKLIKCEYKQLVPYHYPTQLCTTLNEMDFIITPKLHVGIVGATLSKSVVSFSIHTEKIRRFYNQLNEEERTLSMNDFDDNKALAMLEEYHDKKIVLDESILKLSHQNFEYVEQFINNIRNEK